MNVSRRDFMKFCGLSAAAVGLSTSELGLLEKALANPTGPSVIWLQGSGCTGCSESFLNRIATTGPQTAASVLVDAINLVYHPNLMSLAGQDAVAQAEAAYQKGGYLLAVEGGIPTAFGGRACYAWTYNEQEVTFESAVRTLADKAAGILCIGTCAAWGGIPAAPPNPTGVMGVKALTGKDTINIPGCPTHPDWIVWAVVQLLTGYSDRPGHLRPAHPIFQLHRARSLSSKRSHQGHDHRGGQQLSDGFGLPGSDDHGQLSSTEMEQPGQLVCRCQCTLHRLYRARVSGHGSLLRPRCVIYLRR